MKFNFFHRNNNCRIILLGDFYKLKEQVNIAEQKYEVKFRDVKHLKKILLCSTIVGPECFPADVLTMNSIARIHIIDTDNIFTFELVYPGEADLSSYKLSVFTSLGVALIGRKAGETVVCNTGKKKYSARIVSLLFQSLK